MRGHKKKHVTEANKLYNVKNTVNNGNSKFQLNYTHTDIRKIAYFILHMYDQSINFDEIFLQ